VHHARRRAARRGVRMFRIVRLTRAYIATYHHHVHHRRYNTPGFCPPGDCSPAMKKYMAPAGSLQFALAASRIRPSVCSTVLESP
jgi:hypothetical protein